MVVESDKNIVMRSVRKNKILSSTWSRFEIRNKEEEEHFRVFKMIINCEERNQSSVGASVSVLCRSFTTLHRRTYVIARHARSAHKMGTLLLATRYDSDYIAAIIQTDNLPPRVSRHRHFRQQTAICNRRDDKRFECVRNTDKKTPAYAPHWNLVERINKTIKMVSRDPNFLLMGILISNITARRFHTTTWYRVEGLL